MLTPGAIDSRYIQRCSLDPCKIKTNNRSPKQSKAGVARALVGVRMRLLYQAMPPVQYLNSSIGMR